MLHGTNGVITSAANRGRTSRWFYVGTALFMIAVSLAGFGPSIIDQSRRIAPATPLSVAHGVVAASWLLLFLTQAILIASRRVHAHRRIGVAGAAFAFLMVVITVPAVIEGGRRGHDSSGDIARVFSTPPGVAVPAPPTAESVVPLFGTLAGPFIWGVLVAAGLRYRHRPDVHKRLMLVALVYLVDVPLLHLTGVLVSWWPDLQTAGLIGSRVIFVAVLFASAMNDKLARGGVHPVSLWVPLFLVVWEFAFVPLALSTEAWRKVSFWLFL